MKRTVLTSFLVLAFAIQPGLASAHFSLSHALPHGALADLPSPRRVTIAGSQHHMLLGTFTDGRTWRAFSRRAAISAPRVDFRRELVAYVALDVESHFLTPLDVQVHGDRARVRIRHHAGEIAYRGTVPSVFVAVPRAGVRHVDFIDEAGTLLGSVAVP